MDVEFLKERALLIRELAEKADPFMKRRLLDLANKYDGQVWRPSRTPRHVMANLPYQSSSLGEE